MVKVSEHSIPTHKSHWRPVLLIIAAGVAAHGLLVLTDYSIWDGIVWVHHLRMSPVNYELLLRPWEEGGRSYITFYFEPLRGMAHPELPAKWAGLISWIVSAIGLYLFLSAIKDLKQELSLAVALIAVTLPFYDVLGDVNSLVYSMPVAQFWMGFAMLQWSLTAKAGLRRAIFLLSATALLFCSFMLNSNLVLFYGVFGAWFALAFMRGHTYASKRAFVLRYLPLAVLPLVFWFFIRTFYPTVGSHKGWYNEPTLDVGRLAYVYASAYRTISDEVAQLFALPLLVVVSLIAAVACLAWISRRSEVQAAAPASLRQSLALFFAGVVLLACAIFPYAAVNQELASFGWWSRNAILMNVPVAFCICGLFAGACKLLFPKYSTTFWLPVIIVVFGGAGVNNANYLRLQALGAKQQAIAYALKERLQPAENVSVVQLRDYFIIPWTINFYPPIIWSYLLAGDSLLPRTLIVDTSSFAPDQVDVSPTGEPVRIVPSLDLRKEDLEKLIKSTLMDYALEGVPRDGRQLLAVVIPGAKGSDGVQLGLQYLWVKYFDSSALPAFVRSLLECRIQELNRVGA